MQKIWDIARKDIYLWQLAGVKIFLYSLVTLGMAWQTSTAGLNVGMLNKWDIINIVVGMIVLWGSQMISFFDQTATKIMQGKPLVGEEEKEETKGTP